MPDDRRPVFAGLFEPGAELRTFLGQVELPHVAIAAGPLEGYDIVVITEGAARTSLYRSRIGEFTRFVEEGGTLLVLEPELGLESCASVPLLPGLDLLIERRSDPDRGGYDSYVFMEDPAHPLWRGINAECLKMWNGAFGGEIVSQHSVMLGVPAHVHARCGLGLATAAVMEVLRERGRVVVSRLQTRGRLVPRSQNDDLYARRADPVARQYLINLLHAFVQRR
jgi:hypothetical protein